jgi:hypothetical protein
LSGCVDHQLLHQQHNHHGLPRQLPGEEAENPPRGGPYATARLAGSFGTIRGECQCLKFAVFFIVEQLLKKEQCGVQKLLLFLRLPMVLVQINTWLLLMKNEIFKKFKWSNEHCSEKALQDQNEWSKRKKSYLALKKTSFRVYWECAECSLLPQYWLNPNIFFETFNI